MAVVEYIADLTTRGRVTIPKAMRDDLGWQPSDKIHFMIEDDEVKLVKVSPSQGETPDNATEIVAANPEIRRLEP
jgi:AbrB family looped-hinge helix DNA binding protein